MKKTATEFREKCYRLLKRVPEGRVTTYGEIARALGCKAYRAVGMAMKHNPYAPTVPCHRVVASDGSLGGFNGGLPKKVALLRKEGVEVRNNTIVDFNKRFYRL